MADHTGTLFTISNYTRRTTIDTADFTLDQLVDFVATIIADWEDGTYDGTNFTITNSTADRAWQVSLTTLTELGRVAATLGQDNGGDEFIVRSEYNPTSLNNRWTYDADDTTITQISEVLGALRTVWGAYTTDPPKRGEFTAGSATAEGYMAGASVASRPSVR